ncbi:exported hypothetical protein [uncultured Eubacteriales bacterium]|uniref:Uncharacterized protein n=1 Tax=uncultured Eubacteriales bacterium TaxID=172733 RepID=A0A212JZN4_9FIRM|nr:exported hypothetical protein [uncultured Eubacteriales bacterium]
MKRIRVAFLISIIIATLVSCNTTNNSLAGFLKDTNHMRQQGVSSPWEESEKLLLQGFIDSNTAVDSVFSDTQLQELCSPGPEQGVDSSQLVEDVDVLFQLLKETYGAYFYFGGGQTFDTAKQQILDEVHLLQDSEITPRAIESLLATHLSSIIKDSHFVIGSIRISTYPRVVNSIPTKYPIYILIRPWPHTRNIWG